MAVYINHKDPASKDLEKILNKIPPCPGTCIFIDLVESTGIKYKKGIGYWGKLINNTFNFISILNDFPDNIVKGIGDELMIYIPDEILVKKEAFTNHYGIIEELYSTLHNIKSFPIKNLFMDCKVSVHYCQNVYNITFLKSYNDYYGKDIDMAARLMSKSGKNRIVLSDSFYLKVKDDLEKLSLSEEDTCLAEVSGIISENFKGIPFPVNYRTIDV
jgi:class 3 adenylate cyclase